MKRDIETCSAGMARTCLPSITLAHPHRARFAVAVGLASAWMALVAPSALAGQGSPAASEAPSGRQSSPKAERHVELRRVLSASPEVGAGHDNRRKLSAQERNDLRESMRGVYDKRESRQERSVKPRP